ncbi:MAG: DnaD domain protein [Dehalococcoidales bacterium]|nr:DnaD domain protein [Dehalococcoidales bacterium]
MGSRTWIKVYCNQWLEGDIREETPEIRGIFIDLLALCGSSQWGDSGEIEVRPGIGYTDGMISTILHISPELWASSKQRLIDSERIEVDNKTNIITILSWIKYQSEYDRIKKYRTKSTDKSTPISTDKSTPNDTDKSTRIDIERDIDIEVVPVLENKIKSTDKSTDKSTTTATTNDTFPGDVNENGNLFKLYETEVGALTPIIVENLKDAINRYPLDWFGFAFREAALLNKRNWRYIQAILERWKIEGFKPPKGVSDGRFNTARQNTKQLSTEELERRKQEAYKKLTTLKDASKSDKGRGTLGADGK